MNILWAFELTPRSPQFSTMDLENYAKVTQPLDI